jgi:hypothetical protein
MSEAKEQHLDCDVVPAGADTAEESIEGGDDEEDIDSCDDEKPTREVMKERIYGDRRSTRARSEPERLGLMIRTDQLQIVPDRDAD